MQVYLVNIIQAIFIFQTVFGIAVIWKQKRYRGLTVLLLIFMMLMFSNFYDEVVGKNTSLRIAPIFTLGLGPAFYLFISYLIYSVERPLSRQLWHFIPMFIALGFIQWLDAIIIVGSVSQITYIGTSVFLLHCYHKASFATRSDAENMQLFWVLKLLAFIVLVGIVDLIRLNNQVLIGAEVNRLGQLFATISGLFLVSYLIFKSLNQPELFDGLLKYEKSDADLADETNKDNGEIFQAIFNSLDSLVKEQELFKQQRLTLNDLAELSGLNIRDISQAINQQASCSFCDYINKLRVEAIKRAMLEGGSEKGTLLDLALRMGFSSKSNFNLVFKKHTGMTPSQFLKQTKLS